jgi:hypothetical protein
MLVYFHFFFELLDLCADFPGDLVNFFLGVLLFVLTLEKRRSPGQESDWPDARAARLTTSREPYRNLRPYHPAYRSTGWCHKFRA